MLVKYRDVFLLEFRKRTADHKMLKGCSAGVFLSVLRSNIVLNFLVEEGICTEDAECNLRGDIEISVSKLRKTETGNELKYES